MKKMIKALFLMILMTAAFSVTAGAEVKIPEDAGYYNGNAYYVYTDAGCKSYEEAAAFCRELGGHLVIISDEKENEFVYKQMWKQGIGMAYIGYYKLNGKWVWVDSNESGYTNWYPGEPETQNAARFKYDDNGENGAGKWCDDYWGNWQCDDFICEWESNLELSDTKLVLEKGDSIYATYAYTDATGQQIDAPAKWKTSKKSVAKVSTKGKVVAVAPGNCKIICTVKGRKATINVVVKPSKVKSVKTLSKSKSYVQFKWAAQKGVTQYQVFIYDKDLAEYTRVKTVKGKFNTAKIDGLKRGKTYRFQVRASVKVGKKNYFGAFSKVIKVKTRK